MGEDQKGGDMSLEREFQLQQEARELRQQLAESKEEYGKACHLVAQRHFAATGEGAEPAVDVVNHPAHYTKGGIECIDAIRAALTPEEFRGYCKGNAIKYSWRERHKGGNEDLKKASWYLTKISKE